MNFWPGSADPWLTYNAFFGPDSVWFPGDAPADVVDLIGQAETETDSDVRAGVFEDLAQAVDDESLVAIISHPRRPVVAAEDVTGFQGNVLGVPQLRGPARLPPEPPSNAGHRHRPPGAGARHAPRGVA